jgi:hypothetical protein
LSVEEKELLEQAGKKMRFWANIGVGVGFLAFSLPWTMRRQIPYRFAKGMAAGTVGVFFCAPVWIPKLFI